jgi:hypothetical protein
MARVTVGCKHPSGLHLDIPTRDGRKRETVKGNAWKFGASNDFPGGYALTEIDAEHWEEWLKNNKDCSLVVDRVIFALPKLAEAEKEAVNLEKVPALNEKLDPKAVKGVEKAEK